jgi:hypothetical protein
MRAALTRLYQIPKRVTHEVIHESAAI